VSSPEAIFSQDGAVASLTFNRPEARNAMTWAMYDALVGACDRVDGDPSVRTLVLRANGDTFIAGTDIHQFTEFASGADGLAYEKRIETVIERLERVRVPTIAQVHGAAVGGGCVIALVCDLRVCTSSARFGVPVARTLGNCLSAANYARLVDLIGPTHTKDLLFTGRLLDATQGAALGLGTRLADASTIDEDVRALAQTIANNAPLTIHATKEALRRLAAGRRIDPAEIDDLVTACYGSHDFREGVTSFLNKRKPQFTGR
jgi:enoyl-CoA hydratase/carnithine racemase